MRPIDRKPQKGPGIIIRLFRQISNFVDRKIEKFRVRREVSDLGIPAFYAGDLLCHPKGRTLIVISVHHPDHVTQASGQFMIEYTVLCPEGTYDRINEAALASWRAVPKN